MKPSVRICILFIALLFFSCTAENDGVSEEGHGLEDHTVSVTLWGDSLELFMEYEPPIAGRKTDFIIHLTRLRDFSPVERGGVTVRIESHGGSDVVAESKVPLRKGIWKVEVPVLEAGEYHLYVHCDVGGGSSEVFDAGHARAWASEEDMERAWDHAGEDPDLGHDHAGHEGEIGEPDHGDEHGDPDHYGEPGDSDHDESNHDGAVVEITFLKEQQWNTEFGVEPVRLVRMRSSISAVAEVLPRQRGYAEIVAPVEGLITVLHNQDMAAPGTRVEPGDRLVTICPPLVGAGSWTERHLDYARAKQEFERAERLFQRDAIAKRDYERIRRDYLVEKSSYEMIIEGSSAEPVEVEQTGEVHLELKAPIGGIVSAVDILPGQTVSAGQKLMAIVDPSIVWLRANLFERDYYRMGTPEGAAINIPGLETLMLIEQEDLKVLSKGDLFDRSSRTIPIIFEMDNPDELLKIGQIVRLEIYTSQETESVAVPDKSIIDEDYAEYVFVQTGGESFEKRAVKTGARSQGLVAVLEGLAEGERIVSVGAYRVKLASTTREIGHPHAH